MAGAKAITRNSPSQPTAVNSVATSSDPRGNLTFDGVKGFTFDTANRLTGASSSTLRLRTHSQNRTVAARAMADRKTVGQRS